MAIILDQITVGDHLIYSLEEDPRTGLGTAAIVGTMAMVDVSDAGTNGEAYLKVGAADTAWVLIANATTSPTPVETGDFRHLAVYKTDASGDIVNDEFSEAGGGTIEVVVEADGARTADMTYQFPTVPGAVTTADVVLTESDQTINGNKTFGDNVTINGDLDVNGTLTSIDTVNTTILDKLITLNKGGAAASAGNSGIELEEDSLITGWLKTSVDREQWCLKAPAVAFQACLDLDKLTADREFHFPDASGTFLLQPTTPSGVANQITWWLNGSTVTAETGTAPNALTWDDTNNFFGVQTAAPQSIMHVGNFSTAGTVGANAILLGQMDAAANIGAGSTVTGGIGGANIASGTDALVGGIDSTASGAQSLAFGDTVVASGDNSQAFGLNTSASAAQAVAFGNSTTATQPAAFAAGNGADATAANAAAFGLSTTASGAQAFVSGNGTTASFANSMAGGLNASATAVQALAFGSGAAASGDNSQAFGLSTTASGAQSVSMGNGTTATGDNSFSMGNGSDATDDNAFAMGLSSTASGPQSTALGNGSVASGLTSLAWGTSTAADGDYSAALGRKAQTGGFTGAMSLADSQDFTSTSTAADNIKMRFDNGLDLVKGGGANDDDGVNFRVRQEEAATTDATLTTLQTIAIPTDTTVMIKSKVIGARTGGTSGATGDSAGYERTTIFKNIGGTVTIHKRQSDYTYEDQSSWRCRHEISGTNAIVEVRGAANNDVQWEVTSYCQTVAHS